MYANKITLTLALCRCLNECKWQRRSRGHKARGQGQGHKKNPRPRTAVPRTDPIEAKDRNARGQGPRTQPQVFSKKKKGLKKFFQAISKKKVFFKKFFQVFSSKKRLLKFFFRRSTKFQQFKKVLSSSRGQANFRGLDLRRQGQGLQNVSSRPRTSSRTLPLVNDYSNGIGTRFHMIHRAGADPEIFAGGDPLKIQYFCERFCKISPFSLFASGATSHVLFRSKFMYSGC